MLTEEFHILSCMINNKNSAYAALFDELADIATEREVSWEELKLV